MEDESLSSDGASDLENGDLAADDLAQEEARKAGIPELEHDALPSANATKFLPLTRNVGGSVGSKTDEQKKQTRRHQRHQPSASHLQ